MFTNEGGTRANGAFSSWLSTAVTNQKSLPQPVTRAPCWAGLSAGRVGKQDKLGSILVANITQKIVFSDEPTWS